MPTQDNMKLQLFLIILPGIVSILYFITGLIYLFRREYPWALVWIAYAMANIGIIWGSK